MGASFLPLAILLSVKNVENMQMPRREPGTLFFSGSDLMKMDLARQ